MAKIDRVMYESIGEKLRKVREEKRKSLEEVAVAVGLTKKTIQRYETAESRISIDILKNLCVYYNLDYDQFIRHFVFIFDGEKDLEIEHFDVEYFEATQSFQKIPLYDSISCGVASFIDDNVIEHIILPNSLLNMKSKYFCQYASGDSMIDENIQDGDLLVFEKTSTILNGQIGCFCIDENMATCKKFYKDDASAIITLQPANRAYAPIIVTVETMNFHVVGKLALVINKR